MIIRRTGFIIVWTVSMAAGLGSVGVQAQAEHGWVTGNLAAATPATNSFEQTVDFPYRFESFTGSLGYRFETEPSFDAGAGLVLRPHVGVGVAVSRLASSHSAAVAISVPDALRFNLSAAGSGLSADSLPHSETAVHLEGTYLLAVRRSMIRLFAGPSMIRVRQDVITDVQYTETATDAAHTITLTGEPHGRSTDTVVGVNVGADGTVYLDKHVGIGAVVRFSRATATIKNVLQSAGERQEENGDLRVGGLTVGAGLRIRF